MKRRDLMVIGLAALAATPLTAQAGDRLWRLGVLAIIDDPTVPGVVFPELARRGFVEGRTLVVDVRIGTEDQMPGLARELVAVTPDVILAISDWAVRPAMRATNEIPIVASPMGADPVAAGVAASWARPGANVTGVSLIAPELEIKRLDILREAVPKARRIATLSTHRRTTEPGLAPMRTAATTAKIELIEFYVDRPDEYKRAFAAMRAAGAEALVIVPTPELNHDATELAALALESGLPTICGDRRNAERGCLIGYGPNIAELLQQAADDVVRIFQGAKVGELPFRGPTRFESAVNLRSARHLGLTLPAGLLQSADEVIE
jgi:ABC-type uncharacterized transport system substrate-binding protein